MKYKIETDYVEEDDLTYEVLTYLDGSKYWYYENNFHRLNGPAIERANGDKEYWVNDKLFYSFEEYKEAVIQYKINKILNGL